MKRVDLVAHIIVMLDTIEGLEYDITYTPPSLVTTRPDGSQADDTSYFNFVFCSFILKRNGYKMYMYLRGTRAGSISSVELMMFTVTKTNPTSVYKSHFSTSEDLILRIDLDNLKRMIIATI